MTVRKARCDGRYPVPQTSPPREEPFEVTYRCALPKGHDGAHGAEPSPPLPADPYAALARETARTCTIYLPEREAVLREAVLLEAAFISVIEAALRRVGEAQDAEIAKWRQWAQFVYLGGGPVTLPDDAALRAAVCAAQDAEIAQLRYDHEATLTEAQEAYVRDTAALRAEVERLQGALAQAKEMAVTAYQKAQDNWCAQCFCFTSAPEQLRRDAHGIARDGFNEIAAVLGPLVRAELKAEYQAAEAEARRLRDSGGED